MIPQADRVVAIVAMAQSVHAARWVAMLRNSGLRIVVVPVLSAPNSPELEPCRLVRTRSEALTLAPGEVGVFDLSAISEEKARSIDVAKGYAWPGHPAYPEHFRPVPAHSIETALRWLKPDLVHSLEVQFAGYVTLEAKRRFGSDAFPPWLLSNWGSDVMLFRKLAAHAPIIDRVFQEIDAYWSECARDIGIARDLGYGGPAFDPMPASGGMSFSGLDASLPSTRKLLLIKGYHGWSGRGHHILSSLYMAAEHLRDYQVRVMFANDATTGLLREIADRTGLDVAPEPYALQHSHAMARLSRARMVVGLGISDGISTTLLEAMAVGAFPILANSSCACEWIRSGIDGFVVDPHDTRALADAIVTAASDNAMVDAAAPRNREVIARRWNPDINGPIVLAHYDELMSGRQARIRGRAE